jgi:serine phosphatase RsbU (regulator of sigma subunit)
VDRNKSKSIFFYPIIEDKLTHIVFYFEADNKNSDFFNERISLLNLLESQIITLIENSKIFGELEELNRTLEEKVEQRTAEVYQQKEEIAAQRDEIEEKNLRLKTVLDQKELANRTLTDSINYARRIQQSLLPSEQSFKQLFPDSFVLLRPKDVLSGDFYWIKEDEFNVDGQLNNLKIIAAIDCTGHGVPGALMSIIANDLLEQAINENKKVAPSEILSLIELGLKARLQNDKSGEKNKDGMDMSLVIINTNLNTFSFAGAHNPVYYIPKNSDEIEVLMPSPYSIGGFEMRHNIKPFTQKTFHYSSGDTIYMFSDGFYDQIGGVKGRKFMKQNFKELLLTNHKKTMPEQIKALELALNGWKAELRQIDDILVIGIKL